MNRLLGPEVTWTNIKPVSTKQARENLLGFLAMNDVGKMAVLRNKAILRQADAERET